MDLVKVIRIVGYRQAIMHLDSLTKTVRPDPCPNKLLCQTAERCVQNCSTFEPKEAKS